MPGSLINKDFGRRVRELRKKNNLTQEQLAKILGVTKQAVYGYESGSSGCSFTVINKLAEYFNVTVDYLLAKDTVPPFTLHHMLATYPKNSEDRAIVIVEHVKREFGWSTYVNIIPDTWDAYLEGKLTDEQFYITTYRQFIWMHKAASDVLLKR